MNVGFCLANEKELLSWLHVKINLMRALNDRSLAISFIHLFIVVRNCLFLFGLPDHYSLW